WTVIQNRFDGNEDFFRNWTDYIDGFGNVNDDHYLGNALISSLTEQSVIELQVELEDWDSVQAYAHYQKFYVDARNDYQLEVVSYHGTAGDSLEKHHAGQPFSTFDADHDILDDRNCAEA
ncbi:unnamed protein product, partial [Meganyctiphanes norvegica]